MKRTDTVRILLADDHLVVRMGIASILSFEPDFEIVGEAETGADAVRLAAELQPDIVLMDLMMPEMNGAEATRQILGNGGGPRPRILVLTSFGTSQEVCQAIKAGASGALLKTSSREEIIAAVRGALAGETVVSPEIRPLLVAKESAPELSSRQLEVLNLVAKGFSNQDIARILGIGVNGVKDHLKAIFARLEVSSRTEAAAVARDLMLI